MFTENYTNEFLINIDNVEQPIYRIFPYYRIKELFETKELVLVNPRKWEDPYENFFMNSECYGLILNSENVLIGAQKVNTALEQKTIYGQSWTLEKESDALWRIYSNSQNWGVKVKTTIKKLYTAIKNSEKVSDFEKVSLNSGFTYIGKVSYLELKKLKHYDSNIYNNPNPTHSFIINPLLIKRKEFCHEREVRLLYIFDHKKLIGSCGYDDIINPKINISELIRININPQEVFDEMVFDPRIDVDEFKKYKKELNSLCNIPTFKSDLYEAPVFKYGIRLKKND